MYAINLFTEAVYEKYLEQCLEQYLVHTFFLFLWYIRFACTYLCLFAQPCLTLCNPMTVAHQALLTMGIFQAKILEWVAMSSSMRSFQPRDWSQASHTAGGFFTVWATRKSLYIHSRSSMNNFRITHIHEMVFILWLPLYIHALSFSDPWELTQASLMLWFSIGLDQPKEHQQNRRARGYFWYFSFNTFLPYCAS